jgi:hypothetical protein
MVRRVLVRLLAAAGIAAMGAGCDMRNTESYAASPTNVPSSVPLVVDYRSPYDWSDYSLLYRMRVEPGGSQVCEAFAGNFNLWYGNFTAEEVSCDFRVHAVSGRAVMGAGFRSSRDERSPSDTL